MRRELIIKSKSLGGTSDLTLLAPIKTGLVPSLDTVSHKTRIKRLLQTLSAGRSSSQEYALLRPFSDAVERVGKIHSVRVAVLEPENKVLLAVTFDGSWEAYIRVLWQKVGTLLDIIFYDTEGYDSAYDNRFEVWEAWCRRVQVETHFYYGTPGLTVDDVRYLRHEESGQRARPGDPAAALEAVRYSVQSPEQSSWLAAAKTSGRASLETFKQGLEALAALYRLADLYLPSTEDGLYLQRAARDLLLEFVRMLEADEFPPGLVTAARARFDKQLVWLQKALPAPRDPQRVGPPLSDKPPDFDRDDVQGGIVRAYGGTTHGCLLLLAIEDRAKAAAFFKDLAAKVTRDDHTLAEGETAVNVAVTYEGLRAIGLSEDELAMFPQEFREGMEARASTLGDVRTNHPRRWKLPVRFGSADAEQRVELAAVHVVLQLRVRAKTVDNTLAGLDSEYLARPEFGFWNNAIADNGMRLLSLQRLRRNFSGDAVTEHFGFADGGSDPVIDPAPHSKNYLNQVRLGELLLGHGNEADWPPEAGHVEDVAGARARLAWLNNGSFLVIRKLAQDVAALESAFGETMNEGERDKALAKMMGRDKAGHALAHPDVKSLSNDFDYRDDGQGSKCPFHAHVRRANPRVVSAGLHEPPGRRTPRIARRGMSYGPPVARSNGIADSADRGLCFMAYNASIAEQFEVVQRWLSGGNSSGGYSGQSDPFLGVPDNGARRTFRFEDDTERVVTLALDGSDEAFGERKPFVRLEWGAYLFAPSITALRRLRDRLASSEAPGSAVWSAEEGERRIGELLAVGASSDDWKTAIEDPLEVEKFRSASVWAAIRSYHGGVLKTPYGVLVADRDQAMQVLAEKSGTYSVKGYQERLSRSIGAIYLGQDDSQEYKDISGPINEAIMAIERLPAFMLARQITAGVIGRFLGAAKESAPNPSESGRYELIVEVKEFIDPVLGTLCQHWFGLPETDPGDNIRMEGARWDADRRRASYPGHFTAPSRFVFQPNPGPSVERFGRDYGKTVTAAFSRWIKSAVASPAAPWPTSPNGEPAPIGARIWKEFGTTKPVDFIASTLVGAMMGLLPTIDGNLRRSLNEWLYDGTFWTLRERWQGIDPALREETRAAELLDRAQAMLGKPLLRAMQLRPSPELVWRTATRDHDLAGVAIAAGDKVVVSIVSAAQQCLAAGVDDDYMLFGGNKKGPDAPTHACPGYEAAMGVMLGFISALLEAGESVRPSAVPLALTFEGELLEPHPATVEEIAASAASAKKNQSLLAAHFASRPAPSAKAGGRRRAPVAGEPAFVIGLGDSWFHYFAIDIFDALQSEADLEAVSLAEEGTTLVSMKEDPAQVLRLASEIEHRLRSGRRPAAILLSAGGNDVIKPTLGTLLAPRGSKSALSPTGRAFIDKKMREALVDVIQNIDKVCRSQLGAVVPILLHGYDYPHPDGRGPLGDAWDAWLLPDFLKAQYTVDERLAAMIEMIDALNAMQLGVVKEFGGHVHHVDLREAFISRTDLMKGATEDYQTFWGNELHPTPAGFALVATRVAKKISEVIAAKA